MGTSVQHRDCGCDFESIRGSFFYEVCLAGAGEVHGGHIMPINSMLIRTCIRAVFERGIRAWYSRISIIPYCMFQLRHSNYKNITHSLENQV